MAVVVPAAQPGAQRFVVDYAQQIGAGGYGRVYIAIDFTTNETVAAKLIPLRRMRPEAIQRELALLDMLDHPNIIGLVGSETKADEFCIAMELAPNGELFSRVIRNGALQEDEARPYFTQLVAAVDHMHSVGGSTARRICRRYSAKLAAATARPNAASA